MSDRLTVSDAAALAGVAASTWRAYVAREQAPPADGRFDGRTPWWHESTVREWMARRLGTTKGPHDGGHHRGGVPTGKESTG